MYFRRNILLLGFMLLLLSLALPLAAQNETESPLVVETEFLFNLHADLAAPYDVGNSPYGSRVIWPVTGGTIEGPEVSGVILAGGADWSLVRSDGAFELDVRLTILTDDEEIIYMQYPGISYTSPEGETYWRITPRFETGAEQYAWLNRIFAVGIGTGAELPEWVEYSVYAIK
jgi:Protein of unknown function (DUF3237)